MGGTEAEWCNMHTKNAVRKPGGDEIFEILDWRIFK